MEGKKIHLSGPSIEQADIDAVVNVLKGRWLSLGPKLTEFEEKMAAYVGTTYAVALNSGTSALHLAVKALGLQKGDEVIVSPFTFVASANCILFEGATPVFADIKEDNFNIDPKEIEKKITPQTKAIIDVDIFGRPSDKQALREIAQKHNLRIIEDSAEALGAMINGKKAGSFFDCGIYAFYPNKQMTTGEGGMLVTNNEEIYQLARSYRNQGRGEGGEWLEHLRIGFNYRLSDINCALGISQLERIEEILAKRAKVAAEYNKHLADVPGITLPYQEKEGERLSWFVYVIQVANKEAFIEKLKARNIGCAPYFKPLHLTAFYQQEFGYKEGDFPICEKIAKTTVALPFYTDLLLDDVRYVCQVIKEIQNG